MINIDVLCYFLDKENYCFTVKKYDNSVCVTTIRHFDADCMWEHALIVTDNPADIQSDSFPASSIAVYITQPRAAEHEAVLSDFPFHTEKSSLTDRTLNTTEDYLSACPLITVETDNPAHLLNTLGSIMETFHQWEQDLRLFDLTGINYQELIDCSDKILDVPFSLVDRDFAYIGYSRERSEKMGYISELVENNRLSINVAAQLMSTPGFELLEQYEDVFEFEDDYSFIAKNIHCEGTYVARLIIMKSESALANAYHRYVFQRLGELITEKYQRERTFYLEPSIHHRIHTLLQNSLSGNPGTSAMWEQALAENAWLSKDKYMLMALNVTHRHEKNLHAGYLCPQIENMWRCTVATPWNEKIMVLINLKYMEKNFEQSLAYFVRDHLLTAGISSSFTDFSRIPFAYIQAVKAMEIGIQNNPHLWYYFFDQYALAYIKQQCTSELPPEQLCHPALLFLKEYDRIHGSRYFDSLELFIRTQYNMSAAADLAYVHRTTFIKRMERIKELTGIDLTDWDTRLHLMLSYSLLHRGTSQE